MNLESIINKIYQSRRGVQIKLKHDIVCRKIAHELSADRVSILLYRGAIDSLECTGRYINPKKERANVDFTHSSFIHLPEIMGNIDVLEYFKQSEYSREKPTFQDYNNSKFFDSILTKNQYEEFKSKYSDNEYMNQYDLYKKCFSEELHPVDINHSLSGKYYYYLHNNKEFNQTTSYAIHPDTKICIRNLKEKLSSLSNYCRKNLKENLNISLEDGGIYIGIPLISGSNRIIGILRMTFRYKVLKDLIDESRPQYLNELAESLEEKYGLTNISGIIGDRLSSYELLEGFRKISFKESLNQEFEDYNKLADELTNVINCFGCIVRTVDKNGTFKITGNSQTIVKYIENVQNGKDPFVHKKSLISPLNRLFNNETDEIINGDRTIIGSKIKFSPNLRPRFKYYILVNEYQIIEETRIGFNKDSSIDELEKELQSFVRSAKKYFELFDIKEIVLMPIKGVKNSLVTFLNKSTHPFDIKDIELIYIVSQRVGLEFKHIQKTLIEKKRGKEEALIDGTRILFHQLGAPISALNQHIINISRGLITDKEKISLRLEEMEHTYTDFLDMLKTNQFFFDFSAKGRISVQYQRFNITKFIINKIRSYQLRAKKEKGLDIIFEESTYSTEHSLFIDKSLLGHVIQCLVDNAIKYSFSHTGRSNYFFEGSNRLEVIHKKVLVQSLNNSKIFELTITNWGCKIRKNEEERIFELETRGAEANNFQGVGSGIGLYVVKRIIEAFKGDIFVNHDEKSHKTVMKIEILK